MSSGKNKRRQPLSLVINILLVILGLTRALFLFINPYESEQCYILPNCPMILTRLLFGLGLPCFTASFSLIHLTFLQLTKLTLYPAKLQSIKVLICVISIHFGLAIITEVIMFTNANWRWLTIVCQGFFHPVLSSPIYQLYLQWPQGHQICTAKLFAYATPRRKTEYKTQYK